MLDLVGIPDLRAMTGPSEVARPGGKRDLGIVIGCDNIGSAVAHSLHRAGLRVVLADAADPPWPHRGRTFANAWYIGTAELEGEITCFCASVRSIPSVLRRGLIAATTWSWMGLADALDPAVIVDARVRRSLETARLLGHAPVTVAIGPGFAAGVDANVVVESTDSAAADAEAAHARSTEPVCERRRHAVIAGTAGRFMTTHGIGDRVEAGQVVGYIGLRPVVAPRRGVLLGLSARGARVALGQRVVEVDGRGEPAFCFGIDEDAQRCAASVLSAMTRVSHTI
jgi:xanthine dehydrogenase accessory factor